MKHFNIAVLIALISGCMSNPVTVSQATSVPPDRYYWNEKPKSKNPAKLIVTRDTGIMGFGVKADIDVDQKPLASLWMEEKAEVLLDPDSYVIDMDIAYNTASVNQDMKEGQTYTYRISTDIAGVPHLSRVKKLE